MAPDDQDRILVVLVRARNPSNIGASARAMHDLGFRHLRIVNPFPVPFQGAKAAVDASSVLASALEFTTVAEAVADCTYVLGTTAVGERVLEHPLHLLPEAVALIQGKLSQSTAKIALLFGSEKTGLSNDELSHCHALLTIPMNPLAGGRHLSMNLGQAVAVCLYAIWQSSGDAAQQQRYTGAAAEGLASSGDLERLTSLLLDLLQTSGYARRYPANARKAVVRRLVRRVALSAPDAHVCTGILRQFQYALAGSSDAPVETETHSPSSEE